MSGLNLKKVSNTAHSKAKDESGSFFDLLSKDIKFGPILSDKVKHEFYSEFHSMLEADLDIKTSLDLISADYKKDSEIEIFSKIVNAIVGGSTLAMALRKSDAFSPYEYFSIQIGEESGRLAKVVFDLSQYFERKMKQRRQLSSALSYPILILLTSFGAVAFMMFFMVPMFSDVFKRFGGELPAMTQFVINFSNFLGRNWLTFVIFLAGIVFTISILRKKDWFKNFKDVAILKIPFFGPLYKAFFFSQFCNSMSMLISAKVPLINSIDLMEQMIDFSPLKKALPTVRKDLLNGFPLHLSLAKIKLFEAKMITMVKIGEEVTQLEAFFKRLGDQYTIDVDHRTSQLNTFIEPILIIFLGLVVGFILITMYLPMFQISTNLGL